ncbi:methyltransferase FkbM family [Halothece sp. PCC 7418]|uniref:FkbM family methyltransferase n=1 Tax=Halothece sp. (strain PCC 7418) TaxID=65093 RepID=UPI0002A06CB6|nr:FkbM family methyltransferase [Halothece sp. PCC 7418]AFZ44472.1 methyltransferase FkbM family [Halothece sp. PCC 7418]
MRVEACCQSLLKEILPSVDPYREGVCLDVGVGDFAFYCDLFSRLGFSTIAIEPSPNKKLRRICKQNSIQLLECCLSNHNGMQRLHLGRFAYLGDRNFNSLEAEWFASSQQTKLVSTINLSKLINLTGIEEITCLKLDIEGWEVVVIEQIKALPPSQLPKIVMFEYGGGSRRYHGKKGWSPKFLSGTMKCLETLQKHGYGFSIMIDYAPNAKPNIFDLQSLTLDPDTLFIPNAVYGNIISFRGFAYSESAITKITNPYNGKWLNWLIERLITN